MKITNKEKNSPFDMKGEFSYTFSHRLNTTRPSSIIKCFGLSLFGGAYVAKVELSDNASASSAASNGNVSFRLPVWNAMTR